MSEINVINTCIKFKLGKKSELQMGFEPKTLSIPVKNQKGIKISTIKKKDRSMEMEGIGITALRN